MLPLAQWLSGVLADLPELRPLVVVLKVLLPTPTPTPTTTLDPHQVLRLSFQLSVAHPAVRARSAAWVWNLFGALMLLALAMRYGLRIPWVTIR